MTSAPPPSSEPPRASSAAAGPAHANAAAESLELFRRSWQSYRLVLDHDLMDHRALSAVLAQELRAIGERLR